MTYTASEMREMADRHDAWAKLYEGQAIAERGDLIKEAHSDIAKAERDTAQMLREAADAMEKDERRKALDELTALSQELGLYDIQRPK